MTQKVALTCDSGTADGVLFAHGALRFVPSFVRLGDPADQVLIEQAPARAVFGDSGTAPVVDLYPCDLIGPQQDDGTPAWSYNIFYDGCPGNPEPWSFQLLSTGGDSQRLSSLAQSPVAESVDMIVTSVNGQTGAVTLALSSGINGGSSAVSTAAPIDGGSSAAATVPDMVIDGGRA